MAQFKPIKELVSAIPRPTSSYRQLVLRMAAELNGPQANLQLSVVALPAEDDEVIEENGARLFLDPAASELLDDKILDADLDQEQVAFTLDDQSGE